MIYLKQILTTFLFSSFIFSECEDYLIGDLNNDNSLDVIDVIALVDFIFHYEDYEIDSADLNQDLIINIYDVIILIDRILSEYPYSSNIVDINFDFTNLAISWEGTTDYGFSRYNIYYSNFIDNNQVLLYSTNDISETSVNLENIILNEQNFFIVGVEDFLGCEVMSQQFQFDLPIKSYHLDSLGNIINTEFTHEDFSSAENCMTCHLEHYNEWSVSMHSHTMHNPLFFSYKNQTNSSYPETGDRFCMQCHNPIAYLVGEDTAEFSTSNEFQSSNLDNVIKEGITCDVCHTVTGVSSTVFTEDNLSANAVYKMYPLGNIKFGSIENPEYNPYHQSYYLPTYKTSQMCLPCHDLVVRDVEAEITFTEWNRIPGFSMFGGVSCQECHMPIKDNGYHDHTFVGVDVDLSIPIDSNPLYESVSQLLSSAAEISFGVLNDTLVSSIFPGDTLEIPITVTSLTGHNLPSGTSFNREAWVEIVVYHDEEIIYSNGLVNSTDVLNYSDQDLLFFTSYLYDENGQKTHNVSDVHSMDNFSLGPYQDRYKNYNVYIPEDIVGDIIVSARFLFRSFNPDFILQHHPEFIENLHIFEISSINSTILLD